MNLISIICRSYEEEEMLICLLVNIEKITYIIVNQKDMLAQVKYTNTF